MAKGAFMERFDNVQQLGSGSFGYVHEVHDMMTTSQAITKFTQKSQVTRWSEDGRPMEIWMLDILRDEPNVVHLLEV
jgi:serine/threonine protein kinase